MLDVKVAVEGGSWWSPNAYVSLYTPVMEKFVFLAPPASTLHTRGRQGRTALPLSPPLP